MLYRFLLLKAVAVPRSLALCRRFSEAATRSRSRKTNPAFEIQTWFFFCHKVKEVEISDHRIQAATFVASLSSSFRGSVFIRPAMMKEVSSQSPWGLLPILSILARMDVRENWIEFPQKPDSDLENIRSDPGEDRIGLFNIETPQRTE